MSNEPNDQTVPEPAPPPPDLRKDGYSPSSAPKDPMAPKGGSGTSSPPQQHKDSSDKK